MCIRDRLKTVFEVNLSLFGTKKNDHKVLLLFVIRDHVGVTPMSSLSESLTNELEKVWSDLNKPEGTEETSLYDFFDLKFVGLGHKLLQNEKFIEDVKKMGDSFINKDDTANCYFKPNYHHMLPLEGWSMYAENCWEQIEHNKDLDLPTQQILVARFKTEEILNEAFNSFMIDYNDSISVVINDKTKLITFLQDLKKKCLREYDNHANRYNRIVYEEKRKELLEKITEQYEDTIGTFLEDLSTDLLSQLEAEVSSKKSTKDSFKKRLTESSNIVLEQFTQTVKLFQSAELLGDSQEILEAFKERTNDKSKGLRQKALKLLLTRLNKTISATIKDETIHLLSNPEVDLWDQIILRFEETISVNLERFEIDQTTSEGNDTTKIFDFQLGLSEQENSDAYKKICQAAWSTLQTIVHDYLKEDTVVSILRERFDNKFRYDENDAPRLWKNEEEIDKAFAIAKEHALEVFTVLSLAKTTDNIEVVPDISMSEEEYEDEEGGYHIDRFAHLFNELQKEKILKQFRRQINLTVLDSKRSIITTTTHIPIWIYCLLVILGWNEFMMVIRNPLFVTLTLILSVAFYFIHKFDLWGPVVNVARTAVGETRETIKEKLRDFVIDEHEKPKKRDEKIQSEKEKYELQDFTEEKKY